MQKAFLVILLAVLAAAQAKAQSASHAQSGDKAASSPAPADSGFDDKATGDWSGARGRFEQAGLSFNAQLILEGFDNFRGGVRTGAVGSSTFDLNLAVDTEKAFGLKGGEFYADLEDHAGRNPSKALTGDLQLFDKNNADPYFQIFELWYQQQWLDGKLRVKAGKFDGNTEFSVIDNGLVFLQSSSQVSPSFFTLPTTPDPMPGAALFFTPNKTWYASFGCFYSNRSDKFGNFSGHPQNVQPTGNGVLFIGETGLRWEHSPIPNGDGNLKFGAWGHTGTFTRLAGGPETGAEGYYAVMNQTLWKPAGDPPAGQQGRGVRIFMEGGATQGSINTIDWNISEGISWTGPLSARPDDVLGFTANNAHISSQAALPYSHELALESIYRMPICKWAALVPDFQYIIHPGGRYRDAFVGTLQLTIQF